ncbi:cytochrome c biogenesis protein [Bacillus mesophilus]|uniref:Cytochrome c biogenesis protein n=1 Tax=Bacillus mesophilus TaxID=1808955 RepID=A0A6M0Q4I1_9BACI|nr:cytochrome c biogenesis protein ResB [Bacillus mesophilus]MBM7661178.1 cytochrome c biogenesis protein [Bacillus mesophilus]NEY71295.1 cytochrome c biogenesis protein [Bacillus mesophilus]
MENVKCECGHVNPQGTVLCESCGKPQVDKEPEKLLDMRYDGSARRSQTYKKSIVDKIWNFFSSVKVGVWLIVITLAASSLGTIYPQEMYIPPNVTPSEFYKDQYGWTGQLYYSLGFNDLYGSWWYLILIASIGISLVICSIDRVVPLYRALQNQGVIRHAGFLKRQRIFGKTEFQSQQAEAFQKVEENLKKRKYNVRKEEGSLLAEKNRFSRWGPYVNHVGLIIFLIGAMLRFVPQMYIDEVLWIREGETEVIPGTEGKFYLESESFKVEFYDKEEDPEVFNATLERVGSVVKNYQTDVVLYERKGEILHGAEPELEVIKEHAIQVNEPLKHEGYALYQVDYRLNEFNSMSFNLVDKGTEEEFGTLKVDLLDPATHYDLGNGYSVELISYFADFYFDDDGNPASKSKVPNNPAFVFNMITPTKPEGEVSFVAIQENIEPLGENQYKMQFAGIEVKNVSGLTVRKDYTLWILGIGGAIFMIGVIQGMYWNHRRIWVHQQDNEIWIAAHTNKNWFGIKKELEIVLDGTDVTVPADQSEEQTTA